MKGVESVEREEVVNGISFREKTIREVE